MCGITGIYYFESQKRPDSKQVERSLKTLAKRGPDGNGIYQHQNVALGHSRLAIIDVSDAASQPFTDVTGNYTIIFNGEFYNYQEHRKRLEGKGYQFKSTSDTEVLLYLYIDEGPKCLEKVNGFFAFAIYNKTDGSLFIARDRIGIKPLLLYSDEEKLIFASELKALHEYAIPKEIDYTSLNLYFQLNYIPPNHTIYKNVYKLEPGSYLLVKNGELQRKSFYQIPEYKNIKEVPDYNEAKSTLNELLSSSVEKRMIADVPLGAFLSGGIDSSVIVALASQFTDKLNTFSIGFRDQPFFDETKYANLVASKNNTNHTVFSLSNDDLYEDLNDVLEYLDEPFADSSAIAVHILSKHTRNKVTVALSGDGADELFAGYNKHRAHYLTQKPGFKTGSIRLLHPLFRRFPQSRNAKIPNLMRQMNKLAEGIKLDAKDRYFLWCSLLDHNSAKNLINHSFDNYEYNARVEFIKQFFGKQHDLNDVLYSDMHTVLQGDMLRKVDSMSMANSLEVRTPFLDHNVVDFLFTLPSEYKIDKKNQKKILKDTFRSLLPDELMNRPKQGFEVPLLPWFKNELQSKINDVWLKDEFIEEQGIFNLQKIKELKNRIHAVNPGDVQATIWALIVFQHWWMKNFD